MTLVLNIIIGSTRPGRAGPKLAQWFHAFAGEHGMFEPVLVDLADFNLPVFDEPKHPSLKQYEHDHTKRWSASVESAAAFVFVTPEYDYFAPAALVNAIQFLFREWNGKPAGLLSYGGASGGLRSAQSAKLLLTGVNMMPISHGVAVPFYSKLIGEDGVFHPSDAVIASAKTMLDELHRWAVALKPMRA